MYKTDQRNALLEFFEKNPDVLFTAQEIARILSEEKISRSAVYRNLAQLEEAQLIKKHVKQGSKEIFYRYVHSGSCQGKIHLYCTHCNHTFHMQDSLSNAITDSISTSDAFKVDKVSTVLYGTCKQCQEEE